MDVARRQADELLEVVRVLLLLQGSILVATTIEAFIWSFAFAGAAGSSVVLSGAAAAVILVARLRLRSDRRQTRRLVYGVEILMLVFFAVDTGLAIALTGALPPVVALLTRLVLPVSVIALLRRAARARPAPTFQSAVATVEGAS